MTKTFKDYFGLFFGITFIGVGTYLIIVLRLDNLLKQFCVGLLFVFGHSLLYDILFKGSATYTKGGLVAKRGSALLFLLIPLLISIITTIDHKAIKIKIKNKEGVSILKNTKQTIKISYSKDTKTYDINNDSEFLIDIPTNIDSLQFEILNLDWQFLTTHKKHTTFPVYKDNIEVYLESVKERCCIYGKVFITEKRTVKRGIKVTLQHRSTLTDENGNYKFELTESEKLLDNLPIEAEYQNYSGKSNCTSYNQCEFIIR